MVPRDGAEGNRDRVGERTEIRINSNYMNKSFILSIMLLPMFILSSSSSAFAQKASELKYVDAKEFAVLINQAYDNTEMTYSRLPEDMKSVTRKAVWDLGLNSAGLAIRFSSNSKCLAAKWTLLNDFHMAHMPGTGIRGIDLYTLEDGKWLFVGTAQPYANPATGVFIRHLDGRDREYMAYLPLYDGVTELTIGIDSTATIGAPKVATMASEGGFSRKPIVFYGTSITQGGCASRPGMCYTNIIGRRLGCETINLGFSGNARMDRSMADIIARADASEYVIDCLPNCTDQIVRDSGYVFMTALAKLRPSTTIYMVEHLTFPHETFDTKTNADMTALNAEWSVLYKRLRSEGYKNIKYIPRKGLTINDGEQSVDGCHLTDLGFMRMAEGLLKWLK